MRIRTTFATFAFVCFVKAAISDGLAPRRKTCSVVPRADGSDDAPAIIAAFSECGHGGRILFSNQTYHVNSIMNTSGLVDTEIDLHGTLLWGTNVTYWLNHSLPVGYQNQSSAWIFGGDRVVFRGFGNGTLDGNGQVWYDHTAGTSNYPRRPHAITIWNTTNSIFEGLRFVQSQMWTMTVIHSKSVVLRDIYVNNTSHSSAGAQNTDGADTIFSDSITFDRWTVDNGDDSIALKANSTNIIIQNSTFYRGLGVAIGSIGQYKGQFERVENVSVSGIRTVKARHAAYFKTWTGDQVGYPPNGGGGGFGYASNITFDDFSLDRNSGVFAISQCTTFSGAASNCNSSTFNIHDVRFTNIYGSVTTSKVASLQCSATSPCSNIAIEDVNLRLTNGTAADQYLCTYINGTVGFECTGRACEKPNSSAEC